ncbi:MAG: cadherin-like domain-containing protein [Clostridiales bacterium]|nr:cadherin-like domain-containing protein [Clostridiales bacterium]
MKKKTLITLIVFAMAIAQLSFAAVAFDASVSPALNVIATENAMIKTGLLHSDIRFSEADFKQALALPRIRSITIVSLSPATEGTLKLGNVDVIENQTITRANLSLLRFIPASSLVESSSFTFYSGKNSGTEIPCMIYIIPEINYAPTVSLVSENKLNVMTQKGISYYGRISGNDPENDKLYYQIVAYPKKGVIEMLDPARGTYKYTPNSKYTGRDSFAYVVRDQYGNFSTVAKVNIKVSKPLAKVEYADMKDHWAYNAALVMTSKGIMSGIQVGDTFNFNPDNTVTRGDFIVMVMKSRGIPKGGELDSGIFVDDDKIPSAIRGYIAAAYAGGYISGSQAEDGLYLNANEPVTRAEAAVIANKFLKATKPAFLPVFSDSKSIPTWAADALYALNEFGVINETSSGELAPSAALTRADAALILSALVEK